jgi:hypothetical protein
MKLLLAIFIFDHQKAQCAVIDPLTVPTLERYHVHVDRLQAAGNRAYVTIGYNGEVKTERDWKKVLEGPCVVVVIEKVLWIDPSKSKIVEGVDVWDLGTVRGGGTWTGSAWPAAASSKLNSCV